jgi:hypothetical protein
MGVDEGSPNKWNAYRKGLSEKEQGPIKESQLLIKVSMI